MYNIYYIILLYIIYIITNTYSKVCLNKRATHRHMELESESDSPMALVVMRGRGNSEGPAGASLSVSLCHRLLAVSFGSHSLSPKTVKT